MSFGGHASRDTPRHNGPTNQPRRGNGTHPGRGSLFNHRGGNYRKPTIDDTHIWKTWPEVQLKVTGHPYGLSDDIFTANLHDFLTQFGKIVRINILPRKGDMPRIAYVTFDPPPTEPFWQRQTPLPLHRSCRLGFELQDPDVRASKSSQHVHDLIVRLTSFPTVSSYANRNLEMSDRTS